MRRERIEEGSSAPRSRSTPLLHSQRKKRRKLKRGGKNRRFKNGKNPDKELDMAALRNLGVAYRGQLVVMVVVLLMLFMSVWGGGSIAF